jgi:hypothetical protein
MRGETHWAKTRPELLTRGEDQWEAKLTESDVTEIRRVYWSTTATQMELAAQFGMDQTTISEIVRGVLWSHVPFPLIENPQKKQCFSPYVVPRANSVPPYTVSPTLYADVGKPFPDFDDWPGMPNTLITEGSGGE